MTSMNGEYPGIYNDKHLRSLNKQQEMLQKLKVQKLKMLHQLNPGEFYGLQEEPDGWGMFNDRLDA